MSKLYVLNGPQIGRSFELKHGVSYIGRAADNDIRLSDNRVSRKHLKVVKRRNRYFITDLKSRNGTFHNGKYIRPGIEVEAKVGIPIAIGMTVLCVGEEGVKHMLPDGE